jgi:outer membrane protein assembly factor BamD
VRRTPFVLLAAALAVSCAHTGEVDIATLAGGSDEAIWEGGQKAAQRRDWEVARKHYKRIIDGFPQSTFGARARLALADSHFGEGGTANYILAISEYRDFLTLYPSQAESPYAQFQVAEAYFKQRNSADRDQTPTQKALEEYQRLLELYPDSRYIETARQRIVACRQSLGRSEYLAGFFYEKGRKAYRAAVLRYQGIVADYPDYEHLDEVLYHLGNCLCLQGRTPEALPTLSRLVENYPQSPFAAGARFLLDHCKAAGPVPSPSPSPLQGPAIPASPVPPSPSPSPSPAPEAPGPPPALPTPSPTPLASPSP